MKLTVKIIIIFTFHLILHHPNLQHKFETTCHFAYKVATSLANRMEDPRPIETQPYKPGDFSFVTRQMERAMLQDAYDGISRVENGWSYLSRPDVPSKDTGFMFSRDAIVNRISEEIDKDGKIGHSGASYGWVMRQMECIAKQGWDAYVKAIIQPRTEPLPCPCRLARGLTGWCGVAGGGVPACDH